MDKFYCLKLILPDGRRGYLLDSPKGLAITQGELSANIKQFKTYQDAQQFLRDTKIERGGIKAYIRDNNDLIKDESVNGGLQRATSDLFCIENQYGHKLFYNAVLQHYYFDTPTVGYCFWYTEKDAQECIDGVAFKEKTFIRKLQNPKPTITHEP